MKYKGLNTKLNWILGALAVHLFIVNSKLLYHLNLDKQETAIFSFTNFNEPTIIAIIIALAYSIMTVSVINRIDFSGRKINVIIPIVWCAIMDAFGVLIYYKGGNHFFQETGAIYFAIYTLSIIVLISFINFEKNPHEISISGISEIPESEMQMKIICNLKKLNKITQKEIAQVCETSETTVSRILNKQFPQIKS